jgi:general secretion pathway protein H
MPISATGTSTSSPRRLSRRARPRPGTGFTLIELLVVVAIIALLSAGIMLTVTSVAGRDRDLERESDRLFTLLNYAREQAELQTREYGVLFQEDGYEFLVYDVQRDQWRSVFEDEALGARKLPEGIGVKLVVETRPVVLRRPVDAHDKTPQVMLHSDGDLTQFSASLERDSGVRSVTIAEDDKGQIVEQPLLEARTP